MNDYKRDPFSGFLIYFFFGLLILFNNYRLKGQGDSRLSIEYAHGDQGWLNVSYYYNVSVLGITYERSLDKSGKWKWSYFINPHYVSAEYLFDALSSLPDKSYEVGLGLGIKGNYEIIDNKATMTLSFQTGPHYLSDAPERQVPGFLFSNQFKLGLCFRLSANYRVEPSVGFRHMSNAEIRLPNGGINNRLYGIALTMTL